MRKPTRDEFVEEIKDFIRGKLRECAVDYTHAKLHDTDELNKKYGL